MLAFCPSAASGVLRVASSRAAAAAASAATVNVVRASSLSTTTAVATARVAHTPKSVLTHHRISSLVAVPRISTITARYLNTNSEAAASASASNGPAPDIALEEVIAAIHGLPTASAKSTTFIDVREPHEYAQGHIPTAHNVPLSEFQQAVELSDSAFAVKYGFEKAKLQPTSGKDEQVVFYCRGGVRSLKCIGIAAQHGVTGVRNYKGSWGDYAPRVLGIKVE